MVDRAEMQLRKSNGSIGQAADTPTAVRSPKASAPTPSDAVATLPRRSDQLTWELAEVRRQSGQLEAMLEKRTNRVHQLIGERDRLASLLAARDAETLRLRWELGARAGREAPASSRSCNSCGGKGSRSTARTVPARGSCCRAPSTGRRGGARTVGTSPP